MEENPEVSISNLRKGIFSMGLFISDQTEKESAITSRKPRKNPEKSVESGMTGKFQQHTTRPWKTGITSILSLKNDWA